jgi:predicted regulator of Ras-like GTPase activity (Roadblock/LC7/MglB family)
MRGRLLQDLANQNGVQWVALIGPDALPIDFSPKDVDVNDAVAMWVALDHMTKDTPVRMLIRTGEVMMISNRVDEDRILLIMADDDSNLGSLRSALSDAAIRIIDLG